MNQISDSSNFLALLDRGRELSTSLGGVNQIVWGDARTLLSEIDDASIDLSFWSPPYFVGKSYEKDWSFDDWCELLRSVIKEHTRLIKPGGFLAVNIGDILCFPDSSMPRFQADNVRGNRNLYVVTVVAKYVYRETETSHELERIIVACIPNGMLQNQYNPDASDGIWLAGRNAPTLGEDFRVRVSYEKLRSKASWRVEEINFA